MRLSAPERNKLPAVRATGRHLRSSPPNSSSLDVVAQGFRLALHFSKPVLHNIADRYDANQSLTIHDRNVAELARGHLLHDGAHSIALRADRHFARHDLGDWRC